MKERDKEIVFAQRSMSLLYEACTRSVAEIEGISDIYPSKHNYVVEHSADECIKSIVEQLVMAVKTSQNSNEGSTKELKAIVLELQQELQAKDVQISTISSDLSCQLRATESSAKQFSVDLEDARMELQNLEKQVDVLLNQKKNLETQLNELKNMESMASEQRGRIEKLTDELSRKDQGELSEHFGSITCVLVTATHFHVILNNKKTFVPLIYMLFICSAEIECLVQALDEEEKELEILENKSLQLEQMLQEKEFALKTSEVSRTKALSKLATTVDKFDELHSLSENPLQETPKFSWAKNPRK
jgi:golgin subfamily B member 1